MAKLCHEACVFRRGECRNLREIRSGGKYELLAGDANRLNLACARPLGQIVEDDREALQRARAERVRPRVVAAVIECDECESGSRRELYVSDMRLGDDLV